MAATKKELLSGVDTTELPATRVDPALLEPLTEVEVGDVVVMHSRNAYRLARVMEVGPKRVMIAYTTEGAWAEARKHLESALAPGRMAAALAGVRKAAATNYAFYVSESDAATARFSVASDYKSEEKAAADRAKYAARVKGETSEEYVARKVAETTAQVEASIAEANEKGIAAYLTVTTKSVPRKDLFRVKAGS